MKIYKTLWSRKIPFSAIIKSKKGVAIETAVIAMITIFGLSMLLTTVMMLTTKNETSEQRQFEERIYVEQIGESYLTSVKNDTEFNTTYEGYTVMATETELTVVDTENDKTVLTVTLDDAGKILNWKYN